jgi:3-oxoacyl-[acyl-carrier-protein] synthase-1/3-oxoacyl-[acyl-carrier-protein] synthase II
VHAFKAQIGHTLGAGGALELLAGLDALERGVLPASMASGPPDPDAPGRLLRRTESGAASVALKLSSAFGGANAALVVGRDPALSAAAPATSRPRASAFLHGGVHIEQVPPLEALASATRFSLDRLARADALVHLALAAVAELELQCGTLAGAGIVLGTVLGTIETNASFALRLRERGAAAAEPRRFPYTSPNAAAGECSIAFGLTGPGFAVGGGPYAAIEALASAALLVEAGDAPRMVVVAVDDAGPVTQAIAGPALVSGAVAFLLTPSRISSASSQAASARARVGTATIRRCGPRPPIGPAAPERADVEIGHRALVALARGAREGGTPLAVSCAVPPDALARIELEPV